MAEPQCKHLTTIRNKDFPLLPLTSSDLRSLLTPREGETRLGETLRLLPDKPLQPLQSVEGFQLELQHLKNEGVKVALLGVEEDVGPRANCGGAGATGAWQAGLKAFVNMQSNSSLSGREVVVLGTVDVADLQQQSNNKNLEELRRLIPAIDDRVRTIAACVFNAKLDLAFVGGGHNNCLGLLRALARSDPATKGVQCCNLDPHADLRFTKEGRHSGNGFSAAVEEGTLHRYALMGYHKRYNNRAIEKFVQQMSGEERCFAVAFEDWLDAPLGAGPLGGGKKKDSGTEQKPTTVAEGAPTTIEAAQWRSLRDVCRWLAQDPAPVGIELCLDAITFMPCSAWTPSGVSLEYARGYVRHMARSSTSRQKVTYLDLAEGAPGGDIAGVDIGGARHVGKGIAYLLADFCEVRCEEEKSAGCSYARV